jgi:hypothetical protein
VKNAAAHHLSSHGHALGRFKQGTVMTIITNRLISVAFAASISTALFSAVLI